MEKLALEKYPPHFIWDDDEQYDCNIESREIFIDGYKSAQKENNSKLINYLERKYGIVINRTDLDNFLNRER